MGIENVKRIANILNGRKELEEHLNTLRKMQGKSANNKVKCSKITFASEYTSHVGWHNAYDAGVLNEKLVDVAVQHLQDKLNDIDNYLLHIEQILTDAMDVQTGPEEDENEQRQ